MDNFDKAKYNDTFIEEAKEQINEMNRLLMLVEGGESSIETMNELFRLIHTLKGTSALLDHTDINNISHLIEDILDKVKSGELVFDANKVNVLFESVDRLESLANNVGTGGSKIACDDILKKLGNLLLQNEKNMKNDAHELASIDEILQRIQDTDLTLFKEAMATDGTAFVITLVISEKCKLVEGRAFQILRDLKEVGKVILTVPELGRIGQMNTRSFQILIVSNTWENKLEDVIYQTPEVESAVFEKVLQHHLDGSNSGNEEKTVQSLNVGETIRVNVNILDNLLNLVGESMINNIQINQIAGILKHKGLMSALRTSNMLTKELQHYVLQLRMVPLDTIFRRFPRMVRDMSRESGKEINFITEGGDIEIDRGLLDEIGDSLVHLIRNSVGHGIESADARAKRGKDPVGTVTLSAHREHGHVVIEIFDDGNGIMVESIIDAAIKNKIVTENEVSEMNPYEKLALIFRPGLSTAEKVTKVSGRGVGLDVVNSKTSSLGGTVSVETEPGKGTKMILKLPPTMAIIKALLVNIDQEKYAIPLENIVETVKIPGEEIHVVNGIRMFKLRDCVVPLFYLNEEFKDKNDDVQMDISAVIVGQKTKAGLVVDSFIGQQEIVVKSIGKELRASRYFSGATILGDGSVAMIIDVGAFV